MSSSSGRRSRQAPCGADSPMRGSSSRIRRELESLGAKNALRMAVTERRSREELDRALSRPGRVSDEGPVRSRLARRSGQLFPSSDVPATSAAGPRRAAYVRSTGAEHPESERRRGRAPLHGAVEAELRSRRRHQPLGSCTMKYNPKLNEDVARLPGFADAHPRADEALSQGLARPVVRAHRLLRGISGTGRRHPTTGRRRAR